MIALDDSPSRHPQPKGKFLQIARHRVLRWFQPAEAELRRARLQPHPFPGVSVAGRQIVKEGHDEQPA